MSVLIRDTGLHAIGVKTRIPFRYGIATLTEAPYVFVSVDAVVDGHEQRGVAADVLPPKWFTKKPDAPIEDELAEMKAVVRQACAHAVEVAPAPTVFDFWMALYRKQDAWGAEQGMPPLLSGFGASLVERALIDAFCHVSGLALAEALRRNAFGVNLGAIHESLHGAEPVDFLSPPRRRVGARHTVGLADPLTEDVIPPEERLHDGLPQSLQACIDRYGLSYFKIKVPADETQAVERLRQIAHVTQANARRPAFTLDGNEFFHDVGAFRELWTALNADSEVAAFFQQGLLLVEQPLHRDAALTGAVKEALAAWKDRPPLIIDESDGSLDSLPQALACGYNGTSHKNCKGVFRGVANACLLEQRRRAEPNADYLMTGEDLMNVGPVALLQDLAVAAALGVEHVERNGHHYVRGLSAFPRELQNAVLSAHGDLYHEVEADSETFASLAISEGEILLDSVIDAPFGYAMPLDVTAFEPLV